MLRDGKEERVHRAKIFNGMEGSRVNIFYRFTFGLTENYNRSQIRKFKKSATG
jgi:hypothetical protein